VSIPTISAYQMPRRSDLPADVATWRPERTRAALLIHDMQKYFLDFFPPGQAPVVDLLANIARIRQRCSEIGVPVHYTAQPGGMTDQQRGLLRDFWGPGMTTSQEHRDIVGALAPDDGDRIFTKWRYSAFHQSDLLECLSEQGRDQLIICGVYAHIGCMMTASDAFTNNIQAFLVSDAVADFSLADHLMALDYAGRCFAATPDTNTVLGDLGSAGSSRGASSPGRSGGSSEP
jgi:trans-2,3-dihydro-3-hydroxyanthranilic acid synthase